LTIKHTIPLTEDETEASEAFVSVGGQSESFVSVTDGLTLDSTETKHVPDYENINVESWSSGGSSDSNTSGIVKSGSPIVSEEGDYLNAEVSYFLNNLCLCILFFLFYLIMKSPNINSELRSVDLYERFRHVCWTV
jgi:hypothetical protein